MHILSELYESHGITVNKLQAAIQSLRPDVSPPKRLRFLDEMFKVREMEERYLNGEIGRKPIDPIMSMLPGAGANSACFQKRC